MTPAGIPKDKTGFEVVPVSVTVGVDDDDKLVTVPIEKLGDGPTGPIIPVLEKIKETLKLVPVVEPVEPHVKYIVSPDAIDIGVVKVVND